MIHLRYYHPTGGSKDWFAEIRPDGLIIRFGKTEARIMQERFIPFSNCRPDPAGEARNRANQKMNKGYVLVREQPSLANDTPPPPVSPIRSGKKHQSGVSSALQEWGEKNTENWF